MNKNFKLKKSIKLMTAALVGSVVLFLSSSISAAETEADRIIATIKPLHSLVAGVVGSDEAVGLLVDSNASPHNFQIKPSQIRRLQSAHIIFYIDDSLEAFLLRALESLPDTVRKVSMAREAGLTLLPYRRTTAQKIDEDEHDIHKDHEKQHEGHHHSESYYDMHVWLDPENAKQMVAFIATVLSAVYPENQVVYQANANKLIATLGELDAELTDYLRPIQNQPIIVFHDAYRYLQHAYGLNDMVALTLDPSAPPVPTRISAVRKLLSQKEAACIFLEPQFSDRLVKTASEGLAVTVGTLDPLGMTLPATEDLYFELLRNLARSLRNCLSED